MQRAPPRRLTAMDSVRSYQSRAFCHPYTKDGLPPLLHMKARSFASASPAGVQQLSYGPLQLEGFIADGCIFQR